MNEFTNFKLEVFIPADRVDALRETLGRVGAGRIGNYDQCCSVMKVRGYWRPLEGANPFQGEVGKVETGTECKVEVNCPQGLVKEAVKAIRAIHPYEEPVINIIPLANDQFLE